jgi:lysophospholipase L1-like esterase
MRPLTGCAAGMVLCVSFGCSHSNNPMDPGAPAAGSALTYAALGASDVVGVGSSKPCTANFQDCDGNSYVFVAARQLRTQGYTVTVSPLGISGAVIGGILGTALPLMPADAKLVTIFTGANDVNSFVAAAGSGAGAGDANGYIDQRVATFASDFAALVAGTRSRAPGAKIVALNLSNLGDLPYSATATLQQKQWLQRASVGITKAINGTSGITVIDLMCQVTVLAGEHAADGFHPNDSGYTRMAAEVVRAFTSSSYPAPLPSCSRMTEF